MTTPLNCIRLALCLCLWTVTSLQATTHLERFYEDIQADLHLDLNDPLQRELLHHYLFRRIPTSLHPLNVNRTMRILGTHLDSIVFTEKKPWPGRRIARSGRGQDLFLRTMGRMEAAYRGLWGWDCSSDTRLFRAFQPGHRYLAVERDDGSAFGQVELVLGRAGGQDVAYIERFQIPFRVDALELARLLFATMQMVEEQGLRLTLSFSDLEGLKVYEDLGHAISNRAETAAALETAILDHFSVLENLSEFRRIPDAFFSPQIETFSFIARFVHEHRLPVLVVSPKASAIPILSEGVTPTPAPRRFEGTHDFSALVESARSDLRNQLGKGSCVTRLLAIAAGMEPVARTWFSGN